GGFNRANGYSAALPIAVADDQFRGSPAGTGLSGLLLPAEPIAEDHLHQQVVGAAGGADADTEVELPLRAEVEVDGGHDLVLLLAQRVEVADGSQPAVVLQAKRRALRHVEAELRVRRELKAPLLGRSAERFLQGGIERQVPAIDLLVDDRPDLPRPGVGAEVGADVAELGRKTQADGPVPLLRHRDARADVGADEVPSALGLDRAEQIEAGLKPVVEAARDLQRLVEGMMGGENAIF